MNELVFDHNGSEIRGAIERYVADRGSLTRFFTVSFSPKRREKLVELHRAWLERLDGLDVASLSFDARIDCLLFQNKLRHEIRAAELDEQRWLEVEPLVPFALGLVILEEDRRALKTVDPEACARVLDLTGKSAKELAADIESVDAPPHVGYRAAKVVEELLVAITNWFSFYTAYDPMFTWWTSESFRELEESLKGYVAALRKNVAGLQEGEESEVVGTPVGREALIEDLQFEMIPHTPEELMEIADREFSWCEAEMKGASRELGFRDDWRQALEHVKTLHQEPGKQTELVRDLALEAVRFLEDNDLVTVPELAKSTWRMEMMSPERQKVNPFFLGGEQITVSYPTNTMTFAEKQMSMRGNNRHFSRATVQHELIPGHHLQFFMLQRYKPYRALFGTPFWIEGWALWWEMLLWDKGFPRGPEDRVGMLFWRMHRCARIIFSLKFHLGEMSADKCVDFLVERVGHERATAEGEVRRSFAGNYPPLYQLAYMIGGLQFRDLHTEIVGGGKMTNREFHDAVLRENQMPISMLRSVLVRELPK